MDRGSITEILFYYSILLNPVQAPLIQTEVLSLPNLSEKKAHTKNIQQGTQA
jgi:hypothetical protein